MLFDRPCLKVVSSCSVLSDVQFASTRLAALFCADDDDDVTQPLVSTWPFTLHLKESLLIFLAVHHLR